MVPQYLEEELNFAERSAFLLHRNTCSGCREYLKGYRVVVRLCRECGGDDIPVRPHLPALLVRRILQACRGA